MNADFILGHDGSKLFLLTPISDAGKAWAIEHLPADDAPFIGETHVIEDRYVADILNGITLDELTISPERPTT